ncbi:unnamed protein product [Caenorhabditis angaria]|uniref:Uncharacterized protein n=1 Tax=Caenorhabditis angaria TaxID=860376 RepID=A0A9P1IKI7_9PELO|nr:unnamed protein product [Caenorhabditis angaria]
MWIIFFILISSFTSVFGAPSIILNITANVQCNLRKNWCVKVFVLEYDWSFYFWNNYDFVKVYRRKCTNNSRKITFRSIHQIDGGDGYLMASSRYEFVVGLRHSCTKTGEVHDYVVQERAANTDRHSFDIFVNEEAVDGQGERYEENKMKAWKRTKFENVPIEDYEDKQFDI